MYRYITQCEYKLIIVWWIVYCSSFCSYARWLPSFADNIHPRNGYPSAEKIYWELYKLAFPYKSKEWAALKNKIRGLVWIHGYCGVLVIQNFIHRANWIKQLITNTVVCSCALPQHCAESASARTTNTWQSLISADRNAHCLVFSLQPNTQLEKICGSVCYGLTQHESNNNIGHYMT